MFPQQQVVITGSLAGLLDCVSGDFSKHHQQIPLTSNSHSQLVGEYVFFPHRWLPDGHKSVSVPV